MKRDARGFTLLEVLIALAIVGALLVIAFGGMRVALASWRKGEDTAEAHQHVRSLALVLARSLSATYPYAAPREQGPTATILFAGTPNRLEFVTQTAPYPASIPVAFTAVIFEMGTKEDRPGLVIRQRILPNRNPFSDAEIAFNDPTVTEITFSYLDESGSWQDSWDTEQRKNLPRAIRIAVGGQIGGRAEKLPPLTVSLRVGTE
jgi:general secretion pathway protein J